MNCNRFVAAAAFAASLTACVPYSYHDEISELGRGVEDLRLASKEISRATASAARDAEHARWRLARRPLGPTAGCVRDLPAGSPPCALVALGTTPRGPTDVAAAAPLLAALADYAAALVLVVEAVDPNALRRAVDALGTSALALNERLGAPGGKVGSALAKVAMRPLGALIRAELEAHKLDVLRAAITEADPAIATLARPIGRSLDLIGAERLRFQRDELMTLTEEQRAAVRRGLSDKEYAERTSVLERKTQLMARSIATRPAAALAAMVEAHGALRLALIGPERDRDTARDRTKAFAAAALELRRGSAGTSAAGAVER